MLAGYGRDYSRAVNRQPSAALFKHPQYYYDFPVKPSSAPSLIDIIFSPHLTNPVDMCSLIHSPPGFFLPLRVELAYLHGDPLCGG
jgi:hypothetical protein